MVLSVFEKESWLATYFQKVVFSVWLSVSLWVSTSSDVMPPPRIQANVDVGVLGDLRTMPRVNPLCLRLSLPRPQATARSLPLPADLLQNDVWFHRIRALTFKWIYSRGGGAESVKRGRGRPKGSAKLRSLERGNSALRALRRKLRHLERGNSALRAKLQHLERGNSTLRALRALRAKLRRLERGNSALRPKFRHLERGNLALRPKLRHFKSQKHSHLCSRI
jgi:exonuclease VII small subunit